MNKITMPLILKKQIDQGIISQLDSVELLLEMGQSHLFDAWDAPGIADAQKQSFLQQIKQIDRNYPGGLIAYRNNAKRLLQDAKNGVNIFDGCVPSVPSGIELTDLDSYTSFELIGLQHIDQLAIVMVAGGLGERLGYEGIKIEIPLSLVGEFSYLQWYLENIRALEAKSHPRVKIPFVIMTSNDTHAKTHDLLLTTGYNLESKNECVGSFQYCDNDGHEITVLRQNEVPVLVNNDADFSLDQANKYRLQVKPHGHGDVHLLLFNSGFVQKWQEQGKRYTAFIQDTNGQVFNALLPALGVSIEKNIVFNFLTVPREAGEATGSITKLTCRDGRSQVVNVEYNQLAPLLKATINKAGDVADIKSGKSPYPANLNVFITENNTYLTLLKQTKGNIAEFINPKYADEGKTVFKTPTRLETMMQDLAYAMGDYKVQFTNFLKRDVFSPVKNNLVEACVKQKQGNYPDAMMTGEADFYAYFRKLLSLRGVLLNVEGIETVVEDVRYKTGAKVVLHPSFICCFSDLNKIENGTISDRSVLIIKGNDIIIKNMYLDGTLIVRVTAGVKLIIDDINIVNEGWEFVPLTPAERESPHVANFLKIRGYKLVKHSALVIDICEPGEYVLTKDRQIKQIN